LSLKEKEKEKIKKDRIRYLKNTTPLIISAKAFNLKKHVLVDISQKRSFSIRLLAVIQE